ncbi:MAG: OmpH family outer membrane protein [Bacteroidetes bacterium]|nr:OmpH family outer membrane protein [Bacteroidota bacterium]
MKRLMMVCSLLLLAGVMVAQTNIAHINSEAIMQALPEAIDAQKSLDALVAQWESELQSMQADWKQRFDEYDQRKLILTDQARAELERELRDLDRDISEFRNTKFGPNGELFQKQNEVMKPIQNKMFKVLEEIAEEEEYDYIFDKSGEILLLYARESRDLTEEVLTRMQTFGK